MQRHYLDRRWIVVQLSGALEGNAYDGAMSEIHNNICFTSDEVGLPMVGTEMLVQSRSRRMTWNGYPHARTVSLLRPAMFVYLCDTNSYSTLTTRQMRLLDRLAGKC
jgi:hypothetical protein